MRTFWVTDRKKRSTGETSKPIRPNSPLYDPNNSERKKNPKYSWPRSVGPPPSSYKNHKESLTPEQWPMLEESMSPASSNPRLSINGSMAPGILGRASSDFGRQGINIQDIRRLSSIKGDAIQFLPEEMQSLAQGNINTLIEFAQLAEDNAQKARQLANWAQQIVSAAHSTTDRKYSNDTEMGKCSKPKIIEGSSVDKEDVSNVGDLSLSTTSIQERKYCIIS